MQHQPVVVNQEIQLKIENISHLGKGVGRYQSFAVFVPYTLPGEKVLARITTVRKNYALAEPLAILEPAQTRGEPPCQAFKACGGCKLQHQDYGEHLELKKKLVDDSIRRIAKLENIIVHPTLGMVDPWGYRNKVHFQIKEDNGRVKLGFFEEDSHAMIAIDKCLLVDPELMTVARRVEELVHKHKISAYNWETGKGQLRHLLLRKGLKTGEIMVVLVTGPEQLPEVMFLAKELMNKNEKIVSVIRNINGSSGRVILGEDFQVLGGRMHIWERLGNLTFAISAGAFFQVNPRQTKVLYDKALEYAGLTGQEEVLDLYCGVGSISLFLARRAKKVYGVEVVSEAIVDAKRNMELNKIRNAQFLAGKVEEILPKLKERGIRANVAVLDPPRKGCDKNVLETLAEMAPERIVYVSCDPATLARDLGILGELGYRTLEIQPVDMFPWTSHVETVVLITRMIVNP